MSWRLAILPLSAMFVFGSTASAEIKTLGPGRYSCDTAAGKYAEQEIPALQPEKPLTVAIKYISEHADPNWKGDAGISFDTVPERIVVFVGKAQNDPRHIYVDLWHGNYGDNGILDQYPLSTAWIAITLTVDYDGIVQIGSQGHTARINLHTPWPVKTLLHCQSGAFEFQVTPPSK